MGYTNIRISKIENAFLLEVQDENYDWHQYAHNSIDNIIEKIQEVFKQDGKE